jgi:hypothetical protein
MTITVRYLLPIKGKSPGDTEALADAVANAYIDGGLARLASDNDNAGSTSLQAQIDGINAKLVLANYADDAAAATGGVAVGGLYRTAGAVKVRVS